MKQYEYVSVVYEGVMAAKLREHRGIIDRYDAEGWRYVDSISVRETNGVSIAIDLIFEKEVTGA